MGGMATSRPFVFGSHSGTLETTAAADPYLVRAPAVGEVAMGCRAMLRVAAVAGMGFLAATKCVAEGREPMRWSAGELYSALTSERGVKAEAGIAYGPHARHKLDIYRADPALETSPVVIFYYGGGWTDGDRATYKFVGTALAKRGITTIIPDYRVFPEVTFPAFIDDAATAYGWVAANFGKRPIVVAGHSAGGHTAAMLAFDRSYLERHAPAAARPVAVVGMAGPYAFDPTTWPSTKAIFAPALGQADRARPVSFVRPGSAPALLLHGSADTTVKLFNTRDLAAALGKAGTPVKVIEYPDIGHVGLVVAISKPFRWRAPVLDDVVAFVERQARPRTPQ
jgi:acetyl esterase/lipase